MKLKPLFFLVMVCLAFAGCNSNELNNGGADSTMMDSIYTDSVNKGLDTIDNPELLVDSTRREAPVH